MLNVSEIKIKKQNGVITNITEKTPADFKGLKKQSIWKPNKAR